MVTGTSKNAGSNGLVGVDLVPGVSQAANIARVMALRRAGRFMVNTTTGPARSISKSGMTSPCSFGDQCGEHLVSDQSKRLPTDLRVDPTT